MKLSLWKPSVLIDSAQFDDELKGWWPRPLLWLFLLYLEPNMWAMLCSWLVYQATDNWCTALAVLCALNCLQRIGLRLEYSLGEIAERMESSGAGE